MRSMTQVGPSLDNDQTEEVGEYGDGDIVELSELLENFKPEQNHIDRMLLYQITGKELDQCMQNWRKPQYEAFDRNDDFSLTPEEVEIREQLL